jgi:hypothetical protein
MRKLFQRNQGTPERVARVLLGAGLLSLVFVGPQTLFGLFGIIPLATGLLGSCPAYSVLGFKKTKTTSLT